MLTFARLPVDFFIDCPITIWQVKMSSEVAGDDFPVAHSVLQTGMVAHAKSEDERAGDMVQGLNNYKNTIGLYVAK